MGSFFVYILKVAFCLALLYLPYSFLLRKEKLYAANRLALLAMLLLSFLLPFCRIDFSWLFAVSPAEETTALGILTRQMQDITLPDIVVSGRTSGLPFGLIGVCLVYFVGLIACLSGKLLSFIRFFRFRSRGCMWKDKGADGVTLYCHAASVAPMSWMKSILISEQDYRENGREILLHERAHVRYGHSWDMLFVMLAQALQWFNPFVWMLASDLRDIHEYQADLAVLRAAHTTPKNYQLLLIKKAVGSGSYAFANSFNHSLLKKRITMMMKKESSPWASAKYLYMLPVAAICMMACSQSKENNVSDDKGNQSSAISIVADGETKAVPDPLILVDGKEVTKAEMDRLLPDSIASISVLKDSVSVAQFGDKGKNGVIVIKTKNRFAPDEEVFDVVEQMPDYPNGGMKGLMEYLHKQIKYPKEAVDKKVEGRVLVQFIVSKEGDIVEPKILRSVDALLDAEALRVINNLPKWKPGMQKGKPVAVRFTVPITFKLSK
ncbi:MAG: TonB family protein [Bacteroides sp.]|nr:TonB family protein [Bacteroides sp.]